MTITETVLVFVVIPLAVVGLIYALVYGGAAARGKRYRPGRRFTAAPVWFLAEESLDSAPQRELSRSITEPVHHGEVGGASDSW